MGQIRLSLSLIALRMTLEIKNDNLRKLKRKSGH
ncbi:unnamed protein product [Amaranthus hypochondriacus]